VENDSCYTQLPALLLFHCAMYNNIMLTFHQGVGCSLRLCRPPTVLQCPTKTHTTKSPSLRYISACTLQVMCYFNVYCVCMCANETCFIVNFLGRQKPPTEWNTTATSRNKRHSDQVRCDWIESAINTQAETGDRVPKSGWLDATLYSAFTVTSK